MNRGALLVFAADLILLVHSAFVAFVVLGFCLVLLGGIRRWAWVRNPCFRWLHLAAIGVVAAQAWCGILCPLTVWEMDLRARAGRAAYEGSFIAHWLDALLYIEAPAWAFTLAYTLFGLLVLASWFGVRPRRVKGRARQGSGVVPGPRLPPSEARKRKIPHFRDSER